MHGTEGNSGVRVCVTEEGVSGRLRCATRLGQKPLANGNKGLPTHYWDAGGNRECRGCNSGVGVQVAEEEGVSGRRDCPLVRGQNPSETAADESPLTYRGAGGDSEGAEGAIRGVGDRVAEEEGVSRLSRPPARSGPEPLGNGSK